MPWTISVCSIAEVIDRNPELADIDNPRGETIREVCYLRAENENGQRFIGQRLGENKPDEYEAVANRIASNLPAGWQPRGSGWTEDRPCYGSRAYEANQPFEVAEERFDDENPF